jgi:LysM repeat protein
MLLDMPQKRRRDHHGTAIIVCFTVGIILVVCAFIWEGGEDSVPELPENREIVVHSSALPGGESFALPDNEPLFAPHESRSEGISQQQAAVVQPLKHVKKAPKTVLADGTSAHQHLSVTASKAMVSLTSAPVVPGGMLPQIGQYTIIERSLKYDENASPEAIAAAQAKTYIVVSGDILGRIAQKHGCTIQQIQKANRMVNDQIKIGQKLLIPKCDTDSVDDIAPLVEGPVVPTAQRGFWWKRVGVNTTALPKLMAQEGFKKPKQFRAFILEITFDETRQVVTRERAFDYQGTSASHSGWNPASTVKIYAAIAALRRIDELGFTSRAKVTFHSKKKFTTTVGELIEAAIIHSDNIAYNRVVQLASYDKLHKELFTSKFGMTQTALNRGYELSRWEALGENASLRYSPVISLHEGNKTTLIPAVQSKAHAVCSSAACTSLQDLAESTRRLMLQEQLPPEESFNLKQADLLVLRRAMRSPERTRGTEMVDRFAAVFKDPRVKFYSKPGFSEDWFTDNAYIFDPRHNQAWIVVMTGYPGRDSLNSAATVIAKIINSGKLRDIP